MKNKNIAFFISLFVIALLFIGAAIFFNTQDRNRQRIRKHIVAIQPEWERFKKQNDGFDMIKFFDYTGDDGLFGATGTLPSKEHLKKLKLFMESTSPPRPVFLEFITTDKESYKELKSQPKYPNGDIHQAKR